MKSIRYDTKPSEPLILHDVAGPESYGREADSSQMVRTQIYLTRDEHRYLLEEAERRAAPMSAVIRSIIDQHMTVPEQAWANNPMLEPTPEIDGFKGHEDGAINHDHYIYGSPKKYAKRGGQWVPVEPPGK